MYLHKDDKELLRDIIVTVSERTGIDESIVEKDYYGYWVIRLKTVPYISHFKHRICV